LAIRTLTACLLLGTLAVGARTGRPEDRTLVAADPPGPGLAGEALRPARERFAAPEVREVPDFRRHLLPLLGRLGCNGRACHGSFQGQGGFRLSLFGYDFKADLESLTKADSGRVDLEAPEASKVLQKPTLAIPHKGGKRMEDDGWQYRMVYRWIEAGAGGSASAAHLQHLEVAPAEVVFGRDGEAIPLRVVAHWSDGSSEDVTCISRFRTNDESIAEVDADGVVTIKGRGDTHVVAFYDSGVAVAQVLRPVSDQVGTSYPEVPAPTRIDELIAAKLRKLGIVPSETCSDVEFLRRVSLDMTGTLPTPRELEAFAADPSPANARRAAKIDELLGRPTYAARWATKLCEITGDSPRHFEGNAPPEEYSRHWYEWVERRVRENVPYDELVAGIVLGRSRRPGQSYQGYITEQSAYFRDGDPADFTARETMPYYWAKRTMHLPEERALNFSYAFLGVRIECAQCHKHPFDRWTQDDFNQFRAFFDTIGFGIAPDGKKAYQELIAKLDDQGNRAQRERARLRRAQRGEVVPWQEVFLAAPGTRVEKGRLVKAKAPGRATARVLGGAEVDLGRVDDPREPLLDWMRSRDNPYFARAFVNRVWAEYFGVGIIDPPDDLNLANPPGNAALLDYLAGGFVAHGSDMKWLHREIASSQAYQRSARANETNRHDEKNFSRAVVRRLPAEVLFDAIAQATAGSAELARAATDVEERAIGPKGGALVGRRGYDDYASKVFGRSPRDANCDCAASDGPNLLQAVYMQNDQEILAAIERKRGWIEELRARTSKAPASDVEGLVVEAFLRTLGRRPTAAEAQRVALHLGEVGEPVEALRDLLWALLNTREFLTNH
jgi:hypothetical protein